MLFVNSCFKWCRARRWITCKTLLQRIAIRNPVLSVTARLPTCLQKWNTPWLPLSTRKWVHVEPKTIQTKHSRRRSESSVVCCMKSLPTRYSEWALYLESQRRMGFLIHGTDRLTQNQSRSAVCGAKFELAANATPGRRGASDGTRVAARCTACRSSPTTWTAHGARTSDWRPT